MGALAGQSTRRPPRPGGGRKAGRMTDTYIGPESTVAGGTRTPSGIIIDGAVYQLAGQPPVARSHGWGNLSFLRRQR
jgi:hypothetical protein